MMLQVEQNQRVKEFLHKLLGPGIYLPDMCWTILRILWVYRFQNSLRFSLRNPGVCWKILKMLQNFEGKHLFDAHINHFHSPCGVAFWENFSSISWTVPFSVEILWEDGCAASSFQKLQTNKTPN